MRPLALLALGLLACARPEAKEAATPLEQRFLEQPVDAKVNFDLGQQAEATGDFLRADQYYRRTEALATDPALKRQAAKRVIVVLTRARRYQEAHERCRRELEGHPGDRPTRFLMAAILVALDRPKDAGAELEVLRRSGPDDPLVYLELGRLYRDAHGDRPRADAMFRRYLELAGPGPEADAVRFELESRRPDGQETPAPGPATAVKP